MENSHLSLTKQEKVEKYVAQSLTSTQLFRTNTQNYDYFKKKGKKGAATKRILKEVSKNI